MNLLNIKDDTSIIYKNEIYYHLNPLDIKKLPIEEYRKQNLISSVKILPIDLNNIKVIGEAIRQIKINKKKYPDKKLDIERYFKSILEDFFAFKINANKACEKCKQYNANKTKISIEKDC